MALSDGNGRLLASFLLRARLTSINHEHQDLLFPGFEGILVIIAHHMKDGVRGLVTIDLEHSSNFRGINESLH